MRPPAVPLTSRLSESPAAATVHLSGELSLSTAAHALGLLHRALAAHPSAVVVDLAGLTVGDEVALTTFRTFARAAAEWPGCPVLLAVPDAGVHRTLDRMAITRSVPAYPDGATAAHAATLLPAQRRYRQPLTASAGAASTARKLVRQACADGGLRELVQPAELAVSELVSNAVQHGGGPTDLVVTLREDVLHLSVRDRSDAPPARIPLRPGAREGGRGLMLLDAVATGWGSRTVPGGKVVWAHLRLPRR